MHIEELQDYRERLLAVYRSDLYDVADQFLVALQLEYARQLVDRIRLDIVTRHTPRNGADDAADAWVKVTSVGAVSRSV